MSDLIPLVVVENEPCVDSRIIAEQLGVAHINTRELIEQYQTDFEEFGQLRFQTEVGKRAQGGGNPEKFVLLNEDQSYLLLTYSKNTEQARILKKRLVRAFGDHRRALMAAPRSEPTALVPILSQVERYRMAALAPETATALQHVKQEIQSVTAHKKKQPMGLVDCRAILEAVVSDILSWNYACPYAYGSTSSVKPTSPCAAPISPIICVTPRISRSFLNG